MEPRAGSGKDEAWDAGGENVRWLCCCWAAVGLLNVSDVFLRPPLPVMPASADVLLPTGKSTARRLDHDKLLLQEELGAGDEGGGLSVAVLKADLDVHTDRGLPHALKTEHSAGMSCLTSISISA